MRPIIVALSREVSYKLQSQRDVSVRLAPGCGHPTTENLFWKNIRQQMDAKHEDGQLDVFWQYDKVDFKTGKVKAEWSKEPWVGQAFIRHRMPSDYDYSTIYNHMPIVDLRNSTEQDSTPASGIESIRRATARMHLRDRIVTRKAFTKLHIAFARNRIEEAVKLQKLGQICVDDKLGKCTRGDKCKLLHHEYSGTVCDTGFSGSG